MTSSFVFALLLNVGLAILIFRDSSFAQGDRHQGCCQKFGKTLGKTLGVSLINAVAGTLLRFNWPFNPDCPPTLQTFMEPAHFNQFSSLITFAILLLIIVFIGDTLHKGAVLEQMV